MLLMLQELHLGIQSEWAQMTARQTETLRRQQESDQAAFCKQKSDVSAASMLPVACKASATNYPGPACASV